MATQIKKILLITLGWFAVFLGAIGAVLPLLPTTPFLILALACFAKSSPRFHKMLLDNKWFGPTLGQWEQTHTVRRNIKHRAMLVIVASFSFSIWILSGRPHLQLMLIGIAVVLLGFVWFLKESDTVAIKQSDKSKYK
jgi:uncharacterized membrane protein YbaN (DUF454 family)